LTPVFEVSGSDGEHSRKSLTERSRIPAPIGSFHRDGRIESALRGGMKMRAKRGVVIVLSVLALAGAVSMVWGQNTPAQRVPIDGARLRTCFGDATIRSGAVEVTWEPMASAKGARSWRYTLLLSALALCGDGCQQVMVQSSCGGVVTEGSSGAQDAIVLKVGSSAEASHRFTAVPMGLFTTARPC